MGQCDPFTQEDPIGLAGGLNLYGYANGDPINFSDPFGLMAGCDEIEDEEEREACEEAAAAAAMERRAALKTCAADFGQLGFNVGLTIAGMKTVEAGRSLYRGLRAAQGTRAVTATAPGGAALLQAESNFAAGVMVIPAGQATRAGLNQGFGTPNPFSGELGTLYSIGKATPFLSIALDAGETVVSCGSALGG